MRVAHGAASTRAVADAAHLNYHQGMNTKHFLPHISKDHEAATNHATHFHDICAVTKKALERWENEGGSIPEFALSLGNEHPPTSHA